MMEESNKENDGSKVTDSSQLIGTSTTDNEQGVEASFSILPPLNRAARDEPSTEPEEIDDDEEHGQVCVWEGGEWNCRPYKSEVLKAEILQANRKGSKEQAAILSTLQSNGVQIYVVDSNVSATITEITASVLKIIMHVTKQKRCRTTGFDPWKSQRCLLYKDQEGRFFNLTLADYTSAPAGTFKALLDSFSGFQAMSVLTVLCRSFACTTQSKSDQHRVEDTHSFVVSVHPNPILSPLSAEVIIDQFRPAYLSFLLGIVFYEEISYSWIYTAMFVRGVPSISACTVTSNVETDWLRKVIIFALALGGATTGRVQVVLTLFGISLTCAVLLANLGSRAWGFLKWRPLPYGGPVTPAIAYLAAILAGITVPYMGHRRIEAGGKAAMESVIISAVLVAAVFVLSDYDSFQQFLVIGSEVRMD